VRSKTLPDDTELHDFEGTLFEWNGKKAASNLRKHGVTFAEACTVFSDEDGLMISDPDHSEG
jgi:uncharacterized DUF497 family protein